MLNSQRALLTTAIVIATAFTASAQDDSSSPTTNVCIGPDACFTNNTDTSVYYCISTGWTIHHPAQLRSGLTHIPGITPFNWKTTPDFDKCGWNTGISGLSRQSVDRGAIYYKFPNATFSSRPPLFPDDTAGVQHMMLNTYPWVEITIILLCCVVFPLTVCIWCSCGRAMKRSCGESRRKMRERRARSEANRAQKREQVWRLKSMRGKKETTVASWAGGSEDGASEGSKYWDASEKV